MSKAGVIQFVNKSHPTIVGARPSGSINKPLPLAHVYHYSKTIDFARDPHLGVGHQLADIKNWSHQFSAYFL
jgi:hypothetical protein